MIKIIKQVFKYYLFLSAFLLGNVNGQNDTLKIIHTSDIHTNFKLEECSPIFYNLRKVIIDSNDSLKKFFNSVPQKFGVDAVAITGDLIDYFEADITGNKITDQVVQFKKVVETCPVPLYLTLGNHDITSYWVNEKDSSRMQTQVNADKARAEFIRNISCFKNGTYYEKKYLVDDTRYHLFFLDNGYYLHDGSRMLDKTQLDWLNEKIKEIGDEPVILFFHIYFSVGDVNSDGIYFKKDKTSDWPTEKECSKGFFKILNEHKNIKAMFVGHGHKNVWEGINFPSGHKIYQIETATLYKKSNNWRIIKFTNNSIIVCKPGTNEVEIEIK